jgi:hypothetical protein
MGTNGHSELTAKASSGRPDGRFLTLLRAVALLAVVAGAVGSVGLMFWVGHRNPSRILQVLFAIWDLSPFIGLVLADTVSKRRAVLIRVTLYCAMLIITLGSLALYGYVVWRPRPQPAFFFLVVPPASWLLMTIVFSMAALISGRRSRRGSGA